MARWEVVEQKGDEENEISRVPGSTLLRYTEIVGWQKKEKDRWRKIAYLIYFSNCLSNTIVYYIYSSLVKEKKRKNNQQDLQ